MDVLKPKLKGGTSTYESATKSLPPARRSGAREPQKRVTLATPGFRLRPAALVQVPPALAFRQKALYTAAQPPAAGRSPAGRMGWGSHKELRVGSEDWDRPRVGQRRRWVGLRQIKP